MIVRKQKQILSIVTAFAVALTLAACSSRDNSTDPDAETASTTDGESLPAADAPANTETENITNSGGNPNSTGELNAAALQGRWAACVGNTRSTLIFDSPSYTEILDEAPAGCTTPPASLDAQAALTGTFSLGEFITTDDGSLARELDVTSFGVTTYDLVYINDQGQLRTAETPAIDPTKRQTRFGRVEVYNR